MSENKRSVYLNNFTISGGEHCTVSSSDSFAYRFYSYDTGYTSWTLITWGNLQNGITIEVPDDTITNIEIAKVSDISVVGGQTQITVDNNTITIFDVLGCGVTACVVLINTDIVEVTNPITGRTWMDRNIGATTDASSSDHSDAYGYAFQWGRCADGHQVTTSPTTIELANSNLPGHGDFILSPNSPNDWITPQVGILWQDNIDGNWRIPTAQEWTDERMSWSSQDIAGAFASPLKLTAGGYRDGVDGNFKNIATGGYYWSSTTVGGQSTFLLFNNSTANTANMYRSSGLSVRLIKDE